MPDAAAVPGPGPAERVAFAERSRELAGVAAATAPGCLVEDADGRLVAHRLTDEPLPPDLVRAVVSGDLRLLDRALLRRRTLGLVSSGPVVVGEVGSSGQAIVRVPLRAGATHVGALWLLLRGEVPDLVELEREARRATLLLLEAPSEAPALRWCLDGHPDAVLPSVLAGCAQLWVVAVAGASQALEQRLGSSADLTTQCCAVGPVSYAVVGGGNRTTTTMVLRHVGAALAGARAGLSRVATSESLRLARQQADLALGAARTGECLGVDEARSTLVVRHLAAGLETLPDLGPNPLDALRAYDARRASQLTRTLRCWLDAGRDVTATTALLGIHANTLRYRLQRIEQVLQVDLRRDVATGLELHLRLSAGP